MFLRTGWGLEKSHLLLERACLCRAFSKGSEYIFVVGHCLLQHLATDNLLFWALSFGKAFKRRDLGVLLLCKTTLLSQ